MSTLEGHRQSSAPAAIDGLDPLGEIVGLARGIIEQYREALVTAGQNAVAAGKTYKPPSADDWIDDIWWSLDDDARRLDAQIVRAYGDQTPRVPRSDAQMTTLLEELEPRQQMKLRPVVEKIKVAARDMEILASGSPFSTLDPLGGATDRPARFGAILRDHPMAAMIVVSAGLTGVAMLVKGQNVKGQNDSTDPGAHLTPEAVTPQILDANLATPNSLPGDLAHELTPSAAKLDGLSVLLTEDGQALAEPVVSMLSEFNRTAELLATATDSVEMRGVLTNLGYEATLRAAMLIDRHRDAGLDWSCEFSAVDLRSALDSLAPAQGAILAEDLGDLLGTLKILHEAAGNTNRLAELADLTEAADLPILAQDLEALASAEPATDKLTETTDAAVDWLTGQWGPLKDLTRDLAAKIEHGLNSATTADDLKRAADQLVEAEKVIGADPSLHSSTVTKHEQVPDLVFEFADQTPHNLRDQVLELVEKGRDKLIEPLARISEQLRDGHQRLVGDPAVAERLKDLDEHLARLGEAIASQAGARVEILRSMGRSGPGLEDATGPGMVFEQAHAIGDQLGGDQLGEMLVRGGELAKTATGLVSQTGPGVLFSTKQASGALEEPRRGIRRVSPNGPGAVAGFGDRPLLLSEEIPRRRINQAIARLPDGDLIEYFRGNAKLIIDHRSFDPPLVRTQAALTHELGRRRLSVAQETRPRPIHGHFRSSSGGRGR